MNFIKHILAAHEHLRNQPSARPQHVSLYWALFFQWNAERFATPLPIAPKELMQAARIGNKGTFTDTLRDLATWDLLDYRPSHSGGSSVVMQELTGRPVVPEVAQPAAAGCAGSGPTEPALVAPEVGQPLNQKRADLPEGVVPEVGQHSLLGKTDSLNGDANGGGAPKKNRGQVFAGEGLSEAQVDDNAAPNGADPRPGAAPKKKVAPKKKGVRAATVRAGATAAPDERPRRGGLPETTFQQSAVYEFGAFTAAFAGTDYALADLRYYHQRIDTWRDKQTGEPPRRKDWIATAKRFMLNDAEDNRLRKAPGTDPADPGAHHGQPVPGREGAAGYRSSRWD